jgi:DNA polymerase
MDINTLKEVKEAIASMDFKDKEVIVKSILEYLQQEIYKIEPPEETIFTCTACELYKDSVAVGGTGPKPAKLMIVGKAPSTTEEETGIPFSGPAGEMLDKILAAAKLNREDIYMTNVLKHKEVPGKKDIMNHCIACYKWINKEIEEVNPDIILCLGTTAASMLIKPNFTFANDRGVWHTDKAGRSIMCTYHPAYLVRREGEDLKKAKSMVWEDMKKLVQKIEEKGGI